MNFIAVTADIVVSIIADTIIFVVTCFVKIEDCGNCFEIL